jgi:hypothetical protein
LREVPRLKIWLARGSGADSAASASAGENNRNHERGERDPFAALRVTKGDWRRRSFAGSDAAAASASIDGIGARLGAGAVVADARAIGEVIAAQASGDVAAMAGVDAELPATSVRPLVGRGTRSSVEDAAAELSATSVRSGVGESVRSVEGGSAEVVDGDAALTAGISAE